MGYLPKFEVSVRRLTLQPLGHTTIYRKFSLIVLFVRGSISRRPLDEIWGGSPNFEVKVRRLKPSASRATRQIFLPHWLNISAPTRRVFFFFLGGAKFKPNIRRLNHWAARQLLGNLTYTYFCREVTCEFFSPYRTRSRVSNVVEFGGVQIYRPTYVA